MIFNTLIDNFKEFNLPLGATFFDLLFALIVVWFIHRGMKKGFSSIYWLVGNVVGMIVLMKVFNTMSAVPIDNALNGNEAIETMPIPFHIVETVFSTVIGIVMATAGLLVLNILLLIIYQFVKKRFRLINKNLEPKDSKIIGATAGGALGLFVAMSLTTPIYMPLWANYYDNVDNSIAIKMTGGLQESIYGTEKIVSGETMNSIINAINNLSNAEDSGNSFNAILDILEASSKDPILQAIIEDMVESSIESGAVPEIGSSSTVTLDAAFDTLTQDIFSKDSKLTDKEKITKINEIFGFNIEDDKSVIVLGDDAAKDLACQLLRDDSTDPVTLPAACPAD